MNAIRHCPATVAAAAPQPTERSPLLYAVWVLQAAVLILIVYVVVRCFRRRAERRGGYP